jgi:hypothetical protein
MSFKTKSQKVLRYFTNKDLYKNGFRSLSRLKNLTDDPIIVCGAPRSGTTLLISILDSHPDIIAIPFETQLFINKKPNRWFPWRSWNEGFIKLQLNAFLISLNITPENKRWCEKTPNNIFYLDHIFSLLNNRVKVIHIIRDGRDVVTSHHSVLGKFMNPTRWHDYVKAGLRYKDDPRVLTIRYEDIIGNFDESMSGISKFLNIPNTFNREFYQGTGVSANKSLINGYGYKDIYTAKPITDKSVKKWKNDPEILAEFNRFPPAIELLKELKYDIH